MSQYPEPEELARWTLAEPAPGRWQLTDPNNAERVLYLYARPESEETPYLVGVSAQVGDLVPPGSSPKAHNEKEVRVLKKAFSIALNFNIM